ncbi:hypothetical protein IE81DRAFT_347036 [Ceraceosorus guamensis]|uniref:Uncharacterized protein n=1 Tax=Ceraceosorus guamensis TaxID=1522189 RepID=A0A316VZG1_9BASI|nr:hypothetical protein IE81DRAFT_347036 [Ceraceosorus guamensis]PWN42852.1 hypothetical protein IE81DRAFT_347036 [Ceraceosorus guamensis]
MLVKSSQLVFLGLFVALLGPKQSLALPPLRIPSAKGAQEMPPIHPLNISPPGKRPAQEKFDDSSLLEQLATLPPIKTRVEKSSPDTLTPTTKKAADALYKGYKSAVARARRSLYPLNKFAVKPERMNSFHKWLANSSSMEPLGDGVAVTNRAGHASTSATRVEHGTGAPVLRQEHGKVIRLAGKKNVPTPGGVSVNVRGWHRGRNPAGVPDLL